MVLGLNDIDFVILMLGVLSAALLAIGIFYNFFMRDSKIDDVKQKLKPEYKGATVYYLGEQNGAMAYTAKFLEGEGYNDTLMLTMKDQNTGITFTIGPVDWKSNMRVFKNINLLEGEVTLACNIDRRNRVYGWDPIAVKMHEQMIDATIEAKMEEQLIKRIQHYTEVAFNSQQQHVPAIPTTRLSKGELNE